MIPSRPVPTAVNSVGHLFRADLLHADDVVVVESDQCGDPLAADFPRQRAVVVYAAPDVIRADIHRGGSGGPGGRERTSCDQQQGNGRDP